GLNLPSMKPRHIGRGNDIESACVELAAAPSMKPRHIGRGNRGTFPVIGYRYHPFNEAAAHRPRKREIRGERLPAGSAFNEAAAHRPRKPELPRREKAFQFALQ